MFDMIPRILRQSFMELGRHMGSLLLTQVRACQIQPIQQLVAMFPYLR